MSLYPGDVFVTQVPRGYRVSLYPGDEVLIDRAGFPCEGRGAPAGSNNAPARSALLLRRGVHRTPAPHALRKKRPRVHKHPWAFHLHYKIICIDELGIFYHPDTFFY